MRSKKQCLSYTLGCLLWVSANEVAAAEGNHWLCETEQLYRTLLSAQLYGVGRPPADGCVQINLQAPVEQIECVKSDLELCRFRWTNAEGVTREVWGAPAVMHSRSK